MGVERGDAVAEEVGPVRQGPCRAQDDRVAVRLDGDLGKFRRPGIEQAYGDGRDGLVELQPKLGGSPVELLAVCRHRLDQHGVGQGRAALQGGQGQRQEQHAHGIGPGSCRAATAMVAARHVHSPPIPAEIFRPGAGVL